MAVKRNALEAIDGRDDSDEKLQAAYEDRVRVWRDQQTQLFGARMEEREIIANRLKAMGYPADSIKAATGFSVT